MLPRIKQELVASTYQSIVSDPEYNKQIYLRMKEENPVLWNLLISILKDETKGIEFKDGYSKGVAQVYELLRAQSECDEMAEMFGE